MLAAKREQYQLQIRKNDYEQKFKAKRAIAQEYINITKTMEELRTAILEKNYEIVNAILLRFASIQDQAVLNLLAQHDMLNTALELLRDYTYSRSAIFEILSGMVSSNCFMNSDIQLIKQTFYVGLNDLREAIDANLCESVVIYFHRMMATNSVFIEILLDNSIVLHLTEYKLDESLVFYGLTPIIKYQVNPEITKYLEELLEHNYYTPQFVHCIKTALDYKYKINIEEYLLLVLGHYMNLHVLLLVPYCIHTLKNKIPVDPFMKKLIIADRKERPILIDILSNYDFDERQTKIILNEFLLEQNINLKVQLIGMIDMRWIDESEHNQLVKQCLQQVIEIPWVLQFMTFEQYARNLPRIKEIQRENKNSEILHAIDKIHEVYRDQY